MRVIPDSELIINSDGSVFHLHIKPEQLADKIIVMDDRRINAIGTHEELLETNAIYKEVYESQNRHGVSDE